MGVDKITEDSAERNKGCYHFDRHTSDYREQFLNITHRLLAAGDSDGRRAEKVERLQRAHPRVRIYPGELAGHRNAGDEPGDAQARQRRARARPGRSREVKRPPSSTVGSPEALAALRGRGGTFDND